MYELKIVQTHLQLIFFVQEVGKVHASVNAAFRRTLRRLPHHVLHWCGGEGGAHLALHRPAVCLFPGILYCFTHQLDHSRCICKITRQQIMLSFQMLLSVLLYMLSLRITKFVLGSKIITFADVILVVLRLWLRKRKSFISV